MALATKPKIPASVIRKFGRYQSDFLAYAKDLLRIVTKQAVTVPFDLNFPQRVVHDKLSRQLKERGFVKAIILKARQEGISTYTAGRFFRRVHLWQNQKAIIVAHEKIPGAGLFEIYERFHTSMVEEGGATDDGLPKLVAPRKYGEKGMRLVLHNGSAISVGTAKNISVGRGFTFQALHASEFAFWEKAADTFNALTQAVPDKGSEIIIESTANGVGNFFHQMWKGAEAGESDYIAIFLPWWIYEDYRSDITEQERTQVLATEDLWEREALDKGIEWEGEFHKLTPEQLWWRRKTIQNKSAGDVRKFQQEYPSTAREAFLVSGSCFFDEEVLTEYEAKTRPPVNRGVFVTNPDGSIVFQSGERGYCRIWEQPSEEGVYAIGADTASGRNTSASAADFSDPENERGGRDFSCADVVDALTGKQVAQLHGRMAPEVFAQQLAMLGYYYSSRSHKGRQPALVAVEKNHWSGETVLKILQQEKKYPNLYYSRQEGRRFNKPTPVLGWVTSVATRGPLLDGLAMAIRADGIDIACAETIGECFTFVRGDDGKPAAQEMCHDDRVLSLAIALRAAEPLSRPAPQHNYTPPPTNDSPTGW